jgi:hypothetical protein
MRPLREIPSICLVLFVLALAARADAVLLYDVDFGTPPHTVGATPVTGAGPAPRETPTFVVGDPTVLAAFEDMIDQPCVFGNETGDALTFNVGGGSPSPFPEGYDDYYFSLDMVIREVAPGDVFVVFFNAPTINRLEFLSNGDILARSTIIGSWTQGITVHVDVHFDPVNAIWEIWLDGELAHSGPVSTDGRLWGIRLTFGGAASSAAVDNFILHGGALPTDVEDGGGDSPFAMRRTLPPHPNPATEGVTIRWATSGPETVLVEVSDIAGRRVWARTATGVPSGVHSMRWDGRDAKGRALPSGCYFVRVLAKGRALGTEKIVLRR